MAKPETENLLRAAFSSAPPYVQNLVRSGKFEEFMSGLQARLNIHIDIADKVSNEILFTLLGMAEPSELPENLRKEAGVSEELINPIIEEVNRSIFTPLREELRKNPDALKKPPEKKPAQPPQQQWVQVTAPQAPLSPSKPLTQTPIYSPAPQAPSVSAFSQTPTPPNPFVPQAPPNIVLPGATPQNPPAGVPRAPQPAQYSQPRPAPVQPLESPRPAPPAAQPSAQPYIGGEAVAMVRTMGTDMDAVRKGQQPAPHMMNIPQTPRPAQAPAPEPMQPQMRAPQPQQPAPVSPQLSTSAPLSEPAPRPAPAPQQKPQYTRPYIPPTPRIVPKSAPTPASGDPYREPIE